MQVTTAPLLAETADDLPLPQAPIEGVSADKVRWARSGGEGHGLDRTKGVPFG